jgi:antibiotic biosynthesis monooxygenase (ABM) superfamily enzyme
MQKVTGKAATAAYSPMEGHSVVIYTHKFKPQHFDEGVKIVREFPDAQLKFGHKRHNIFLMRPTTNEIVNVSFFDGGPGVDHWNNSNDRRATVEKLKGMLDGEIDVQVFKVVDAVGVS